MNYRGRKKREEGRMGGESKVWEKEITKSAFIQHIYQTVIYFLVCTTRLFVINVN